MLVTGVVVGPLGTVFSLSWDAVKLPCPCIYNSRNTVVNTRAPLSPTLDSLCP